MYTNKTLISLTNLAQQITPQNETKYLYKNVENLETGKIYGQEKLSSVL